MKRLLLTLSLSLTLALVTHAAEVTSPNRDIKVDFQLVNSVPTYSVSFRGKTIVKPSKLGYE